MGLEQNHRLSCADLTVWASLSSSLSSHCLHDICAENIKCGRQCLTHVETVEENLRSTWRGCSSSVQCLNTREGETLQCADRCLAQHREEERKKKEEKKKRKQQQEERKEQALLSVQSSSPLVHQ